MTGPAPRSGWWRFVAETAAWGVVCLGVWVVTLSTITVPELVLGALVAAACGALGAAARRALGIRGVLPWRWLRSVALLPAAVPLDAIAVLRSLRHGEAGRMERVHLNGAQGDGAAAEGRRAAYVLLVSASPGSVVLDVDPASGVAVVHVLGAGPPHVVQRAAR